MNKKYLLMVQKIRPNLKKSTVDSYERNIKKVFQLLQKKIPKYELNKYDINEMIWILDSDNIISVMKNVVNSSKRAYFATIVVFIDALYMTNINTKDEFLRAKESREKINIEIEKIKNEMRSEQREQKMSPTEKKNWMKWDEIQQVYNDFYKRNRHLLKKNNINTQDKEILQQLLLLAIFTQQAPRRPSDYVDMIMTTDKSYTKYKNSDNKEFEKYNYIVIGQKTCFIFNNYKTNHTYGQQTIQVKPRSTLTRIIRAYCKLFPETKYLFSHIHDENISLNADAIGKKIKKIFMSEKGKAVGATMLRHIYISNKYSDPKLTLADKDKIALNMGHSQGVASEVYHKISNTDV